MSRHVERASVYFSNLAGQLAGREIRGRPLIRKLLDVPFQSTSAGVRLFGKDNSWAVNVDKWSETEPIVIYSAGVGKDVSTEIELSLYYNCDIKLYDPSPTGLSTIEALPEKYRSQLTFTTAGLAETSGIVRFSSPQNEDEGSFRVAASSNQYEDAHELPCVRVSDEFVRNGHSYVHLLKLDVEGFEYGVLRDVVSSPVTVAQICVEFHHFLPGCTAKETRRAIRLLRQSGYRLIHKNRYDYTFLLANQE